MFRKAVYAGQAGTERQGEEMNVARAHRRESRVRCAEVIEVVGKKRRSLTSAAQPVAGEFTDGSAEREGYSG